MTVIDDYLKNIDPMRRKQLERIRRIAKRIVPDAVEVISYGMPTLQCKGTSFLGFDAHTNHLGIYPYGGEEIEVYKDKLKGYGLSKGAIRVSYDTLIPDTILKEIILHRIKRILDNK